MAIIRYYCTHCSHAFEAEEKENMECPSCVWTSSVVRESEHHEREAQQQTASSKKNTSAIPAGLRIAFDAVKPLLILGAVLGLIAAGFVFLKPQVSNLLHKMKSRGVELKVPSAEISGKSRIEKKSAKSVKTQASQELGTEKPQPVLSEQEKAVLARKIELDPTRELSPMEKELLSRAAVLKTGRIEKLPSPVWNLERFEKLLEDQQTLYQVPLPRSYRKKLKILFESKYLAGAQAFTESRLLEARNLWVEALQFPIFANDIEKHRGVVLTMLRSFINDTLSKIGALNAMLVESPVRDRETQLNGAYEQFKKLLTERNWNAAYEAGQKVLALAADFDTATVGTPQVPPYPPSAQIDRDIGKSLYDLLEASRPAVADVGGLERDVRMKTQVIETLLPERFTESTGYYHTGLAAMDQAQWQSAIESLSKVKEPALLQRDSAEKIKILEKIIRAELDSSGVTR